MMSSSILTLLRINLSHLELFYYFKQFITAIQSKISQWWKLHSDQTRVKSLFKTNEKYRYGLRKFLSKHLKMLLISKIIRIWVGEISLNGVAKSCLVFPSSYRHLYFVVEVLMVFSNVKARTQWSIARSKFTSFFSAEIVACDVGRKAICSIQ